MLKKIANNIILTMLENKILIQRLYSVLFFLDRQQMKYEFNMIHEILMNVLSDEGFTIETFKKMHNIILDEMRKTYTLKFSKSIDWGQSVYFYRKDGKDNLYPMNTYGNVDLKNDYFVCEDCGAYLMYKSRGLHKKSLKHLKALIKPKDLERDILMMNIKDPRVLLKLIKRLKNINTIL